MLSIDDIALDALLKRLNLVFTRRSWHDAVARAERDQWSYRDFLATMAAEEVAHRAQTGIARRTRQARFPFLKTIEEFDFSHQSTLRQIMLGSFLAPEFVPSGGCLILQGKPGRGKTHLAIAIAYKAILNGFDALFITAAELIEELCVAAEAGRMHEAIKRYVNPAVLIIDEVGYLSLRDNAANVLYHVINRRYLRRKPIVFTTNKPLPQWGNVLHDPDLAAAILDRVMHRGRLVILDGPSIRNQKPITGSQASDPSAIISGTLVPDLTEPTPTHRSTPSSSHATPSEYPICNQREALQMDTRDAQSGIPLAYFITVSTYGSRLPGDPSGWVERRRNQYGAPRGVPCIKLQQRSRWALRSDTLVLSPAMRSCVERSIRDACRLAGWAVIAIEVRTNHFHVLVASGENAGQTLSRLKGCATRALRATSLVTHDQRVWSKQGSTKYVWTSRSVVRVKHYIEAMQDDVDGVMPWSGE
jgi:DNA replication protein DnaC/REP element-mobilizing transposase RayT